jgi:hypothetical protein
MEVIHEEIKILEYNLMKFKIAQLRIAINRQWNLKNII